MATTTNGALSFSVVSQVVDGTLSPSYKWFSLQNNVLDGSFHPIDSGGTSQIGWWSSAVSDASGAFSSYPVLTTDIINAIYSINIVGDSLLDEYPVDFDVNILDVNDTIIYTVGSVGNSKSNWVWHLDKVYSGKIRITVKKVNKPGRSVKLIETNNSYEIYRSDAGTVSSTTGKTVTVRDSSATTGTVSAAETKSITVSDSSTDSGIISVTDVTLSAGVSVISSDAGTISQSETSTETVRDNSAEAATISASETSFFTIYEQWSSDAGTISATEISTENVSDTSSDAGSISISDISALTVNDSSVDSTAVSATEMTEAVTVSDSSNDSGTVSSADSSFMVQLGKNRSDVGTISSTEAHLGINVTDLSSDNGTISISEVSAITCKDYSTDIGTVSSADSTEGINVSLASTDTDQLTSEDVVTLPFAAANDTNPISRMDQVIDHITTDEYKWFSLEDNVLDGSYHPIGADSQVGWWSNTLSQADNTFAIPLQLTYQLGGLRAIGFLRLAGDLASNTYPVNFDIDYFDNAGNSLGTANVRGNYSPIYEGSFPYVYARKIVVTIYSINKPNTLARILELDVPPFITTRDYVRFDVVETSSLIVEDTSTDTAAISSQESRALTVSDSSTTTGTISASEQRSINVSDVSSDIGTISNTEAALLTISGILTDSGTISNTEADSITVYVNPIDSGILSCIEDKTITVYDNSWDTSSAANVVANESSALSVMIVSGDAGSFFQDANRIVDKNTINVTTGSTDSATINVAESSALLVSISRPDAGTVGSAESSTPPTVTLLNGELVQISSADSSLFVTFELWRNDAGSISEAHSGKISATLQSGDAGNLSAKDKWDLLRNSLSSSDSGSIGKDPEFVLSLTHNSVDNATISIKEEVNMTNVHTVMDEDIRQIYGKVEITYTDPFIDESITMDSDAATAHGTNLMDVANAVAGSRYKWFSLAKNKLDGTFHPIAGPDTYNREIYTAGWWGTDTSDAYGYLTPQPHIHVNFSERSIYSLKVSGDDILQEYPTEFVINLYDATGTVVYTTTVKDNTKVFWESPLASPVLHVTKMELIIQRVNNPGVTAKLTEFYTAVIETYDEDTIESIYLLEEQDYKDTTVPIGNISANQIEIRLNNADRRFDPANADSPLYKLMKKNRRIKAWLGAEVLLGEIEWHPLGVFWSLTWNAPTWEPYAEVIARDRLELLRLTNYQDGLVRTGASVGSLARDILDQAGLVMDTDYVVDASLDNITIPYAWIPAQSHRDALAYVVAAGLARCYCDRDGRIMVVPFAAPTNVSYTFSNEMSIYESDHPVAWSQLANEVQVTYTTRKWSALQTIYDGTDEIILAPGESVTLDLQCDGAPVKPYGGPSVTSNLGNIHVQKYTSFSWGQTVILENTGTADDTLTEITLQGQELQPSGSRTIIVKDDQSIWDNGRQVLEIKDQPLIQSYALANQIATNLLASYKDPRNDALVRSRGNIGLRIGDRVTIPGYRDSSSADYVLTRQEITWDGSLESNIEGIHVTA